LVPSTVVSRLTMRRTVVLCLLTLIVLLAGALAVPRLTGHRAASTTAAASLSTATAVRRDLASRERVNGTLGFAGQFNVNNQYALGVSPTQAASLQHAVDAAQVAYNDAGAKVNLTNQIDASKVAADKSQLSSDQQRYNSDGCFKSPQPPVCAQDQQAIASDQKQLTQDQDQQQTDRVNGQSTLDQAKANLISAEDNQASGGSTGSGGSGSGSGNGGAGASVTVTWLPQPGDVISRGQTLYKVNRQPIPLFYGGAPLSRQLSDGVSGDDVQELEQNLLGLGYGNGSNLQADGSFGAADAAAVKRWQQALGVPVTGIVNPGDVVILPGLVRVSELKTAVGATISPGTAVMTATSTTRIVQVNLDANLQALVKEGDPVEVSVPNGNTTTGKVQSVAKVATPAASSSSPPTVAVTISLDDPKATGALDQAPVTVSIISETARGVLAVPIASLLAKQGGGYIVEVMDEQGHTRFIQVQVGLFDDQDGLVAVSGGGISAGTRVVVPSIS
jgi:peptidoglycan hydrolase-like protein with peptidoglycan-binding domain